MLSTRKTKTNVRDGAYHFYFKVLRQTNWFVVMIWRPHVSHFFLAVMCGWWDAGGKSRAAEGRRRTRLPTRREGSGCRLTTWVATMPFRLFTECSDRIYIYTVFFDNAKPRQLKWCVSGNVMWLADYWKGENVTERDKDKRDSDVVKVTPSDPAAAIFLQASSTSDERSVKV